MYEFARAEDEIVYGQVRGLAVALGVISAVLLLIFRSPGLALLALIPNAIPLWLIFGTLRRFRTSPGCRHRIDRLPRPGRGR